MSRILKFIGAIGAKHETCASAPTQLDSKVEEKNTTSVAVSTSSLSTLDRYLDRIVAVSGSTIVLVATLTILFAWALLGIRFGQATAWQVGISDAQAIVNMVFDAFLMRQQFNSHHNALLVSCRMRSRAISHKRMLQTLSLERNGTQNYVESANIRADLPQEGVLSRISGAVSMFMGHIATVTMYWICIAIWVGFGPFCGWSEDWLFYINSATSALMIFMLAFLANVRESHEKYSRECLDRIDNADCALERLLRRVTNDTLDNEYVTIPPTQVSRIQRFINFYADLVGTLLGIAILIIMLAVWVAIGPAMKFGAGWWLVVGTYAGLIGMNDGFVLRNVQQTLGNIENDLYEQQILDDQELMDIIGTARPGEELHARTNFNERVSVALGTWCSHELMVVAGLVLCAGLITGASALGWNNLGQLICNIPPSIIESFFTLILITGHNIADEKRRRNLSGFFARRLELTEYVESRVR